MVESRLNPLSVEHLLLVRNHYRHLIFDSSIFQDLPTNTNWLRWGYLDAQTLNTLGTVEFGETITIRIHPMAFDFDDEVLVKGIIRHELIHVVLGAEEGHGALFTSIERTWDGYEKYHHQKKRFFRHLRMIQGETIEISYACPKCERMVHVNEPLRPDSACRECCKAFNDGKWCETYTLIKVG